MPCISHSPVSRASATSCTRSASSTLRWPHRSARRSSSRSSVPVAIPSSYICSIGNTTHSQRNLRAGVDRPVIAATDPCLGRGIHRRCDYPRRRPGWDGVQPSRWHVGSLSASRGGGQSGRKPDRQIGVIASVEARSPQSRSRVGGREHPATMPVARRSRTAGWIYRPKAYTLLFGVPPPKLL